jgi:hypothetical protein
LLKKLEISPVLLCAASDVDDALLAMADLNRNWQLPGTKLFRPIDEARFRTSDSPHAVITDKGNTVTTKAKPRFIRSCRVFIDPAPFSISFTAIVTAVAGTFQELSQKTSKGGSPVQAPLWTLTPKAEECGK